MQANKSGDCWAAFNFYSSLLFSAQLGIRRIQVGSASFKISTQWQKNQKSTLSLSNYFGACILHIHAQRNAKGIFMLAYIYSLNGKIIESDQI